MNYRTKPSGRRGGQCRRTFFRSLIGETIALFDELRGKPQFRLSELRQLPDEVLARIIPVVDADVEIVVTQGKASARRRDRGEEIFLFDCEPPNTFVFNRFNGLTTIGRIGQELAAAMAWDGERGFLFARDFFLRLVRLGICVPGNPIE